MLQEGESCFMSHALFHTLVIVLLAPLIQWPKSLLPCIPAPPPFYALPLPYICITALQVLFSEDGYKAKHAHKPKKPLIPQQGRSPTST